MIPLIIQARMTSQRFPGKVLLKINGRPLIGYLLERLKRCKKAARVIVATSRDQSDRPICDYCRDTAVECFQGNLENVAERFKEVIEHYRLSSFIRICGDSPFIDSDIIDQGIKVFEQEKYEIVTNCLQRSFPNGQHFEILKSDIFIKNYPFMRDPADLEHVTQYFYRNADKFKIYNMQAKEDYSHIKLSVDTAEDLEVFKKILGSMERPFLDYGWQEIVEIYKKIKSK